MATKKEMVEKLVSLGSDLSEEELNKLHVAKVRSLLVKSEKDEPKPFVIYHKSVRISFSKEIEFTQTDNEGRVTFHPVYKPDQGYLMRFDLEFYNSSTATIIFKRFGEGSWEKIQFASERLSWMKKRVNEGDWTFEKALDWMNNKVIAKGSCEELTVK